MPQPSGIRLFPENEPNKTAPQTTVPQEVKPNLTPALNTAPPVASARLITDLLKEREETFVKIYNYYLMGDARGSFVNLVKARKGVLDVRITIAEFQLENAKLCRRITGYGSKRPDKSKTTPR